MSRIRLLTKIVATRATKVGYSTNSWCRGFKGTVLIYSASQRRYLGRIRIHSSGLIDTSSLSITHPHILSFLSQPVR